MQETVIYRSASAQILGLFAWLGLVFIAATLGAVASINAVGFYAQLIKPTWFPPASVFGPVWSVLYALMGIAAWLVWRKRSLLSAGMLSFVLQLGVNVLWSWLFFAWKLGLWACADILVLLFLIALCMQHFRRASRLAAFLLLPYFCWVGFASVLTWVVWRANPGLL